jgi:hypothetical protein
MFTLSLTGWDENDWPDAPLDQVDLVRGLKIDYFEFF